MGSCFKFNLGRKREYSFKAEGYQAAAPVSGTYRQSTVDVEGWDPDVSVVKGLNSNDDSIKDAKVTNGENGSINGVTGDDITNGQDPQIVVSCPSNSDITFGEKFQDVEEESSQGKGKKGEKKSTKSKKDKKDKKEKKEKEKKSKKSKKDKKNKEVELKENRGEVCDENSGNGQEGADGAKDARTPQGGRDAGDIGDKETLPREDRYAMASPGGDTEKQEDTARSQGARETGSHNEETGSYNEDSCRVGLLGNEDGVEAGVEGTPRADTLSQLEVDLPLPDPALEEGGMPTAYTSGECSLTPTEPEVSEGMEDACASMRLDDEDAGSLTKVMVTETRYTEIKATLVSSVE